MLRIGIDIGGTFTDFAVWRSEDDGLSLLITHKELSTPPRYGDAVRAGLQHLLPHLKVEPGEEVLVGHGTTVGTNTIIERTGASLLLLVTAGFHDLLGLGRLRLPRPMDLFNHRPAPLVPRERVFEIPERLRADGTVDTPLDGPAVREAALRCRAEGHEGIVICFMHSYRNPCHEIEAREIIAGVDGGLEVLLSSEVWPKQAEYERATLAVLNAYVKPAMSGYLGELQEFLARQLPQARLFVARSDGATMSVDEARRLPVHTLLSGPAAGVTASAFLGKLIAKPNLLTMDMGGTSTDLSLVHEGSPIKSSRAEVGDFPLGMPVVAIEAMGAGGGSIAWLDEGVLRIGPKSAGATPGPACYGRGGSRPTLSDAYLLCGLLGDSLLGGRLRLDSAKARDALSPLAATLNLSCEELAGHCVEVATSTMLAKALPFLASLGMAPETLTLVLFGGAGAIHGPLLASELGIAEIIVPSTPSVFCAVGCVVSSIAHEVVCAPCSGKLEEQFSALEAEVSSWLDAQIPRTSLIDRRIQRTAAMRYRGQAFDIDIAVTPEETMDEIANSFHREHLRLYGHYDAAAETEFVELRARCIGVLPMPTAKSTLSEKLAPEPIAGRRVLLGGRWYTDVPVFSRTACAEEIRGPALIEQPDATILLPPGFVARQGLHGELRMVIA